MRASSPGVAAVLLVAGLGLSLFAILSPLRQPSFEQFLLFTEVHGLFPALGAGALLAGAGIALLAPLARPRPAAAAAALVGLLLGALGAWPAALGCALLGLAAGWAAPSAVPVSAGLAAASFAMLEVAHVLVFALKDRSGVFAEAWRLMFAPPYSAMRILSGASVALVVVAALLTPLALPETRALRAFARREGELRQERPLDAVLPYAGAEGEGVAFDGPAGRLLLLRPPQGIGPPREVAVAAPAAEPPP